MTQTDGPDPLLVALASLSTHAPHPSRSARTRARCHAAMAPAVSAASPPRPRASVALLDRLLPAAGLVYALVALAEAITLRWLKAG
jgi:hypothetical protein